jgi:hypothetical protein
MMPLFEVVGRAGIEAPAQNGPAAVKVGVIFCSIDMVRVVVVAHCPAFGVKV